MKSVVIRFLGDDIQEDKLMQTQRLKISAVTILVSMLALFFGSPAIIWAQGAVILEPTQLSPLSGSMDFEAPAAGPGKLVVINGPASQGPVSGGMLRLNGELVLGPQELTRDAVLLEVEVVFETRNTLQLGSFGRGGKISIEAIAFADTLELEPIAANLVFDDQLVAETRLTALGLPVPGAEIDFQVSGLPNIPISSATTDSQGVAMVAISGFDTGGLGSLDASFSGSGGPLVDSAAFEVLADPDLEFDQGLERLSIEVGTDRYASFSIKLDPPGGTLQSVTLEQVIAPDDGGLVMTTDYPGGFSANAETTFVVNGTLMGLTPGSYTITSTATVVETGESRSEITEVEVFDSLMGQLALTPPGREPAGLEVGETGQVMFTALATGTNESPASLELQEVDAEGSLLQTLGSLFDDGAGSDLVAGDLVYTASFEMVAGKEGKRFFRVHQVHDGSSVFSEASPLEVTRFPVGSAPSDPTRWRTNSEGQTVVGDEILVGFAEGVTSDQIITLLKDVSSDIVGYLPALGVYQVKTPDDSTAEEIADILGRLRGAPEVDFAEESGVSGSQEVPPDSAQQWGPAKIRADEAWVVAGSNVLVAVIDTGVDYNHPDLSALVINGKDFANGDDDAFDDNFHGTHVAGIVSASHNGVGVTGVSFGAPILGVKVLGAGGFGSDLAVVEGIRYAVDQGAKVLNLSLGAAAGSAAYEKAVFYATTQGSLMVAAAGNHGASDKFYPAAYEQAFAVGNTKQDDGRNSTSAFGSWVDIAAPGTDIYATMPGNTYANLTGTSMAAPHVAGAAAMVWTQHPSWTATQVREHLERTTAPLPAALQLGAGRLDLFEAVFGASFESGDLAGWAVTGNCTTKKLVFPFVPVDRSRMLFCTTGPAGDQVAARMEKSFTVRPEATSLPISFVYNFVTEEYPEFVGSIFDDDLKVTLVLPDGSESTLAFESVNTSTFSLIGGIDLPGGDFTVGHTGAAVSAQTFPNPAPGTYRLVIDISDAGDDIFDSLVLLDHIQLK